MAPYRYAGAPTLLTGLEAWWSLDETSGTRADSHTNSYDLTEVGTVSGVSGLVSNAADIDNGTHERLVRTNPIGSGLQFDDEDFTWAGWIYLHSLPGANLYRPFIEHNAGSGGSDSAYSIHFWYNDGSNYDMDFLVGNGSSLAVATVSGAITATNTWYHIIAEHDSVANTISVAVNNGTPGSTSWSGGSHTNTGPLLFGAFNHLLGNSGYEMDGLMDEWVVWRRTLTDAEKAALYNSGSGMAYPG